MHITRAVVLAAGAGTRLLRNRDDLPKPLIPFAGEPLVGHTLAALAANGITDVTVVTGYREQLVRDALCDGARWGVRLTYRSNPRFRLGASLSLAQARPVAGDAPFLLAMSDHLLDGELLARLLAAAPGGTAVAADFLRSGTRTPAYIAEATKVATDDAGMVTAIGKTLDRWDALDAGAFVCWPDVWDALDAVAEGAELSELCSALAERRRLGAVDVSGCRWFDVDTAADLREAEALLAAGD